jgi:hypothetical protein
MKNLTNLAVQEYLASGKPLTELEAIVLFGSPCLTAVVTRMRKAGQVLHSRRVALAAVIRRINEFAVLQPPKNLPVREIQLTEWWVSE